jgi:hypothetical protein
MLREYRWVPNANPEATGQPFVEPETPRGLGPYRHHLLAGDGHRLPFPLSIIRSDRYCRAEWCRVRLFSQSDLGSGSRPGVDYFMEIQLAGRSNLVDQVADTADALGIIVPTTGSGLLVAGLEALGLAAAAPATALAAGAAVLTAPNPSMASESTSQVRVHLSTGTVTLQYEYLP